MCVPALMCVCVLYWNAFPQVFFDIFKGNEQSRNCKFSYKHDDLKWFPFQTVKLVTESFAKFHVLIKLLMWFVKLQNMSLKVCSTYSTHLWSYLWSFFGMLYLKGVNANLHSFPFNFRLQIFLVFFLEKSNILQHSLRGQSCICIQWY